MALSMNFNLSSTPLEVCTYKTGSKMAVCVLQRIKETLFPHRPSNGTHNSHTTKRTQQRSTLSFVYVENSWLFDQSKNPRHFFSLISLERAKDGRDHGKGPFRVIQMDLLLAGWPVGRECEENRKMKTKTIMTDAYSLTCITYIQKNKIRPTEKCSIDQTDLKEKSQANGNETGTPNNICDVVIYET